MKLQPTASHFVNGTYLEDVEGTSFDTVDPATGETLATLKAATPSVVSSAVRSAQMAQCKWAATPPADLIDLPEDEFINRVLAQVKPQPPTIE